MLRSKMRMLFVVAIVTLYATINSHAAPTAESKKPVFSDEDKELGFQLVVNNTRKEAFSNLDEVTVNTDKVVAPLSLSILKAIVCYASLGDAKKSFLGTLGIPVKNARIAKHAYSELIKKLANYGVDIKTRIFIPTGFAVEPFVFEMSQNFFNADVEALELTNTFMDSGYINDWMVAQTKTNSSRIYQPHQLGPNPKILFVNTIGFKGIWKTGFDRSLTLLRPFHPLDGGSVDVMTMNTVGLFRQGQIDECDAQFIELPYRTNPNNNENPMSMFIIMPNGHEHEKWSKLVANLKKINLMKRLSNSTEKMLDVYLPVFKVMSAISAETLSNIQKTFDSENTENPSLTFSSTLPSPPTYGEVLSHVVIQVNEQGGQAAISSGAFYGKTQTSERKTRSVTQKVTEFKVNRPFIAIIGTKGAMQTEIFFVHVKGSQFKKVFEARLPSKNNVYEYNATF